MKKLKANFSMCMPGFILYQDMTFSMVSHFDASKIPIGVIVSVSPNHNMVKAIALTSSEQPLMWSFGYPYHILSDKIAEVSVFDFNGERNTAKIIENGHNHKNADIHQQGADFGHAVPAAMYCVKYHTEGTRVGDWYLGAIDEMLEINKNISFINKALARCKAETLKVEDPYWSSSEFSYSSARYYVPHDRNPLAAYYAMEKENLAFIRPMIALANN